jgi:NADH dehydrogenase
VGDVAVVGGTGFLGAHVCAALRAAGRGVRVLSRRVGADARTLDPDRLRGCDAVVNLAGLKREAEGQTFRAVHVDLVARLRDAMKAAGVRRLVHVSVVVARPDPWLPYHDTKWAGEELVRASGLDWTILRPGVIYGVGDDLLSHLSKMLRIAPVFPIVNDGRSPMMPVHAGDVARAVLGALEVPGTAGKTIDVVGPERLPLRDVVRRVADALGAPVWIWPTPAGLLKFPVRVMEAMMAHPLSTRAQLAMLEEGLAGDPEAARRELGVEPAPFTPDRLRPLLAAGGLVPKRSIGAAAGLGLLALAPLLLTLAFRGPFDPWTGMTGAMALLGAAALGLRGVRDRVRPTLRRVGGGLAAGALLYGLTRAGIAALRVLWPAWEGYARELTAWKGGHSPAFLAATLVLIVAAEELFWRGVVTKFFAERLGVVPGILVGALAYAAAHAGAMNPLLIGAALGCGLYWGLAAEITDDLTAPIVSHLLWDVLILFVVPPF